MRSSRCSIGVVAALALAAGLGAPSFAQVGTSITYQGVLERNGVKVNTASDMRFTLFDAATGGNAVGNQVTRTAESVSNGLFNVALDFGVNPYTANADRWMQIEVRNPAGAGTFTPMGARQKLTPSPFSLATRGINVAANGDVIVANGNLKVPANLLIGSYGGATNNGGRLHLQSGNDGTFDGLYLNPFPNGGNVYVGNGAGAANLVCNDNVGIGTGAPGARLQIDRGPDGGKALLLSNPVATWASVANFNNYRYIQTASPLATDGNWKQFNVGPGGVSIGFPNTPAYNSSDAIYVNGNVGIGTSTPATRLSFGNYQDSARPTIALYDTATDKYGLGMESGAMNFWAGGSVKAKVRYDGVFEVKTLQINGGSDLVEGFDSQTAELEPGTLMVIDPAHPGQLMPCNSAYDSKVAGIVSGAGGVHPGIKMGQDGVMDGKNPIAMTGRVYVKATAGVGGNGAIKPGDLLTTSDVAGHAMKASDENTKRGVVIGKAMSALDQETGLVLVLVNLQ